MAAAPKSLAELLRGGPRGTTVTLVIRLTAAKRGGKVHGKLERVTYSKGARRFTHTYPPKQRPKVEWQTSR